MAYAAFLMSLLLLTVMVSGCGLVIDAIEWMVPAPKGIQDAVCERDLLQVGISAGPYPPFVFPVVDTDHGPRVSGLDVELAHEIVRELRRRCGKSIRPVVRLVPSRDLFGLVQEGKIEFFISAVPAGVPTEGSGGFAYSLPYLYRGGLSVIAHDQDVIDRIHRQLRAQPESVNDPLVRLQALSGLTVAVQEGSSGAAYANVSFGRNEFIICNSLHAAFDAERFVGRRADLIIGSQPVLNFIVTRLRHDWHPVMLENGKPLQLTHENYSIVLGSDRLPLRWFINNLLFRLEETGELDHIRHRWLEEQYDDKARSSDEGLAVQEGAKEEQARHSCYMGSPSRGRLRSLR
ncbi:MAG TPA: transporter substrate-binding domain-containing protein [Nitrospiraceae bacterium]|nr:transporter substrate-binding domain-containing protein [Nitrospiraceae bacterium]